jgi:hypothetical protein
VSKEQEDKKEEELIIVEEDPNKVIPPEEKPKEEKVDDADEDDADDEHADEEEHAEEGDARAATDADADNEQTRKKRKTSKERRARQKAYAERRERELNFYAKRNEELETKFSELEQRQRRAEGITIGQAITQVDSQIREAERLEAEAIKAQKGEEAVEARSIRESLQAKRVRLVGAQERAKQPPADTGSKTPPPEMQAAMAWVVRNKDWYDPKARDEDSALAQTIEDRMTREGKFHPATDAFWEELDRRLQARGVGKRTAGRVQDAEDAEFEEVDEKPEKKEAKKEPKKTGGGPKVSVNGSQRSLKANEVYVSPERKSAMMEAGVWDDPVLRQKLLKKYQEYDRNASR